MNKRYKVTVIGGPPGFCDVDDYFFDSLTEARKFCNNLYREETEAGLNENSSTQITDTWSDK